MTFLMRESACELLTSDKCPPQLQYNFTSHQELLRNIAFACNCSFGNHKKKCKEPALDVPMWVDAARLEHLIDVCSALLMRFSKTVGMRVVTVRQGFYRCLVRSTSQ